MSGGWTTFSSGCFGVGQGNHVALARQKKWEGQGDAIAILQGQPKKKRQSLLEDVGKERQGCWARVQICQCSRHKNSKGRGVHNDGWVPVSIPGSSFSTCSVWGGDPSKGNSRTFLRAFPLNGCLMAPQRRQLQRQGRLPPEQLPILQNFTSQSTALMSSPSFSPMVLLTHCPSLPLPDTLTRLFKEAGQIWLKA